MTSWFDKSTNEILSYLQKEYDSTDMVFIGQYYNYNGNFRFVNVKTTDYFSLNFLGNDELNIKLKGKKLWVHAHNEITELRTNIYYQFRAKLSSKAIRERYENPFALQIDELYKPIEYNPNPKDFIARRFEIAENTHFANNQQLAKALNSIQREINKSPETFIFELLQNASDYPDKTRDNKVFVSFKITNNFLLFCHSGALFKVNNVHSICSINESDKSDSIDKIGFKGIGFKSVFKDCNFAYIKSGGYSFRFDSSKFVTEKPYQIIPIWSEESEMDSEIVEATIFKKSTVSIALKPRRREKLEEYHIILNRLFTDDRILLFLPNIENAKIITPTGFKESKKNLMNYWMGKEQVLIPENIREWINKEIDDNESVVPEKYYDIQSSTIQFATSRIGDQILKTPNSVLYNYLPTKVDLGFDFLINGDFIPDGTREFLHNIKWNDFLIYQSGILFLKWLKSIGEKKEGNTLTHKFKKDYLIIIPDFAFLDNQIIDERNKHLLSYFKEGFELGLIGSRHEKPIAFIPSYSGILEPLSNILIDETKLSDLLGNSFPKMTGRNEKQIHKTIGKGIDKIKSLIARYNLGIVYTSENLKIDLQSEIFKEWLKAHYNNFQIIKFLFNSKDPELNKFLHTEKIILSKANELFKASELFNSIPDELEFIGWSQVNSSLKKLLIEEKIILELKEFKPIDYFKANTNHFNRLLINEHNIINLWNFIYDSWSILKTDEDIKKSLSDINILCKPSQTNELVIKKVSSTYLCKELAKDDEVETIITTLRLKNKFFILPILDTKERPNDKLKWNEILKTAKSKNGLFPFMEELVAQLKDLEDTFHFKATIEIFKYWKINKEKPTSQLTVIQIKCIQESLKLKCDGLFYPASQCIISEYYSTDKRISEILPSIVLGKQIIKDYQPVQSQISDWKQFFTLIGCKDLNSEQKIFNEKIDYLLVNQKKFNLSHFRIIREISILFEANQHANVPINFDFENKLSKIYLQTSIADNFVLPNEIHLPSEYSPILDIQNDPKISNQFNFLSPLYFENKIGYTLLNKLGVNDNYSFKIIRTNFFSFYPIQILHTTLYLSAFWKFIISSDYNLRCFILSDALNIIKTTHSVEVIGAVFKKPTELYSQNISSYIEDKSLIPYIDFTKYMVGNINLEMAIGINQILNINQCISVLKRLDPPTSEKIFELKIVKIMQGYTYTPEYLEGVKLPNSNYSWYPLNELYYSHDAEIITQHPNNLLHSDFKVLSVALGIGEISKSNYTTKYTRSTDSKVDEIIKTKFKLRSEYIAFIIADGDSKYSVISDQIKSWIGKLQFIECDNLYDIITFKTLEWKRDRRFLEGSKGIYFIDELISKKSELKKYLFKGVSKFGKINEKVFYRYLFDETEKKIIQELDGRYDNLPEQWIEKKSGSFKNEVEEFIKTELENTEWNEYIPVLKNLLELSLSQPKEKQNLFNFVAKLKLAKHTNIHFDKAEKDYNQLKNSHEKYFVHSARNAFAYIHPNEILRMKKDDFKMALDFGSRTEIKIYETAEQILQLNTSHLLLYQYEKSIEEMFSFCEANNDAHKHLLIIDKTNSNDKTKEILQLLNPEDDYQ